MKVQLTIAKHLCTGTIYTDVPCSELLLTAVLNEPYINNTFNKNHAIGKH